MSGVKLEGNALGTGVFTIKSPNSNTDRTFDLPDSSGILLNDQSAVAASQIANALNASGSAPIYACRAWVNFNGTGTVAIRASGNVTSITDNGVGDYTVNFTTAMPDANYNVCGSSGLTDTSWVFALKQGVTPNSSYVRVCAVQPGVALKDDAMISVSIFR